MAFTWYISPDTEVTMETKPRNSYDENLYYLQKYKDGGLSDIQVFNEADGFTYTRAGGTKTETELLTWLGHRAQVGKLAPFGFPKNNKFLKD